MHEHHRQRMLARLEKSENSLEQHELLEILLFNAIPRKNTNEIAHMLLDRFGSIREALNAPAEELKKVDGVGRGTAAYLRILGILYARFQKEDETCAEPVHIDDFAPQLSMQFMGLREEVISFFLTDRKGFVTYTQKYTSHREAWACVKFNELSQFIINHPSSGLIVAHNHPTAVNSPSKEDDVFTKKIAMICELSSLRFYDHIVFGINGPYSYRRSGRLEQIEQTLKENPFTV